MTRSRELAEDLVQDVFFRMLRYRTSYDPERPFTAWMYQIARNASLDQAQKRGAEVVGIEEAHDVAASAPQPLVHGVVDALVRFGDDESAFVPMGREHVGRSIRGGAVDDQVFEVRPGLGVDRAQRVAEMSGGVVAGSDDGNLQA